MQARLLRFGLLFAILMSAGAGHRTQNFIVTAPSPELAREIGEAAESYRHHLAVEWLGSPLPPWPQPCPISVQVGPNMGAGGATSFMFEGRHPFGWRMSIQGSRERLLDSVLPHEVTHTIFATHFGRPLPRWADEGACTTVEHPSEIAKQEQFLMQFLRSSPPRSIPFNRMFRMTEYPHDILPLYAQGHSVARYLIQQGGKRKFVDYVGRGMDTNNWDAATAEFFGYRDLSELQLDWIAWVADGSPVAGVQQLASLGLGPKQAPTGSAFGGGVALAAGEGFQPPRPQHPVARGASPGVHQVASVESGSWYARQRESARSASTEVPLKDMNDPKWLPGSAQAAPPAALPAGAARAMARPQGFQRPSPQVLQWDPGAGVAAGPGVELRRRADATADPIYYDAPVGEPLRR